MSAIKSRSKYWCFTVNNFMEQEHENICDYTECTYLIVAKEMSESGTAHLQGYVEFDKRICGSKLLKMHGWERSHIEVRKGNSNQASEYCKKDSTRESDIFERGTLSVSKQGKRTDMDSVILSIEQGMTLPDLWQEYPKLMIRYSKGISLCLDQLQPPRRHKGFPLESFPFHPILFEEGYSHILVGESGCGKTSYIKSLFPTCLFVRHMDALAGFNPAKHEAICFDDMSFIHTPRTAQIHLVDQDDDSQIHVRYTCAFIPAHTPKYFTTNVRNIFDLDDKAIKRRVKVHNIITSIYLVLPTRR